MKEENFKKFVEFYAGHDSHYGVAVPTGKISDKGKVEVDFKILDEPVTDSLYQQHLAGEINLSICPINKEGLCKFGVIDIDDYQVSHQSIAITLKLNGLRFVIHRTKSGGAHLTVFFKKPIPASDVRRILRKLTPKLSYANAEIFPTNDKEAGGVISLPYFDADNPTKYAFDDNGQGILDVDKYIELLESSLLTRSELLNSDIELETNELRDGPPCLEFSN